MTEVDLVVVGAGLAGLVAAATAAEADARSVVLERADAIGGTSARSAGLFAFAGTPEQDAAEVLDSNELLRADLIASAGRDDDLIDLYVMHQAQSKDWLSRLGIGWALSASAAGSGQATPRTHMTDPVVLLDTLVGHVRASRTARIATRCRVTAIKKEGRDWMITMSSEQDGPASIRTASVVFCAGGFGANRELVRELNPAVEGAELLSAPGCDGATLELLMTLGVGTRDLGVVEATFGKVVGDRAPLHPCLAIYLGAVALNRVGRRFVDESRPYKEVGRACLGQPGGAAIQVMDQRVLDVGVAGVGPFDLRRWVEGGHLRPHRTIAELAGSYGLDTEVVQRELDTYNGDIATYGRDRVFGRSSLPGGRLALVPIAEPPFYSCLSSAAIYGTYGGVCVDRCLRVATPDGMALDGCYAAGEIVGGFHGGGYMTGTSLCKAVIFGRLAARHALGLPVDPASAWAQALREDKRIQRRSAAL